MMRAYQLSMGVAGILRLGCGGSQRSNDVRGKSS